MKAKHFEKKIHKKASFGLSLMNVFVEHDWFWSPFVKAYLRHREKEQSLVKTIKYAMKKMLY